MIIYIIDRTASFYFCSFFLSELSSHVGVKSCTYYGRGLINHIVHVVEFMYDVWLLVSIGCKKWNLIPQPVVCFLQVNKATLDI